MTTETSTTTPTAPTPEARLAALAEANRLTPLRDAEPELDISGQRKVLTLRIADQLAIAHAPEPVAPPAGPTWQERRQHREDQRVLREELVTHTEQGSPEAKAVIEDVIAEHQAFSAKTPSPPVPTYTAEDIRAPLRASGMSALGQMQFTAAADRLGASPVDRMLFALAIRDSPPESDDVLTEDAMYLRAAAWWGDDMDANLDHAERAWTSLTAAERSALRDRRGGRQFLESLLQLGKRLAPR